MNLWLEYIFSLLLQTLGFILFLIGFFPRKNVLPGFNTLPEGPSPFLVDNLANFDKLIFIVVDALRSDFMFSNSSLMHFLHSLIREGSALPYTAYSHPPTVTLPRLKGITTGGAPSFIDAVFNIADDNDNSQGLSNIDSWLYQFQKSSPNGKMHFYGDDTWLKLFPGEEFFEKYEGTDSFFVSDFTEVDNNVTRHLNSEIQDHSWDALILHYLGLDHIGHKSGPNSVYMKAKQEEMDSILKKLYQSRVSTFNSTLLLIMGDHGMNNIGNHGGSSEGETSPGLVLASPLFKKISTGQNCPQEPAADYKYFTSILQIDLVPTLAALLNFPIPKNNLGVIIPEILQLWPDQVLRRKLLLENCRQLLSLLRKQSAILMSELKSFNENYSRLSNINSNSIEAYYSFLKESQSLLASNSTEYLYDEIWAGYLMVAVSCFGSIYFLYRYLKDKQIQTSSLFALFCVAYAVHFHGSSLIEEEYQFWWLLTMTALCIQFSFGGFTMLQFLTQLSCVRLIRSWNNSGQKFSTTFTAANVLLCHGNLKWLLVFFTYLNSACVNESACDLNRKNGTRTSSVRIFYSLWLSTSALLSISFKVLQSIIDGQELPRWLQFVPLLIESYTYSAGANDKKHHQDISIQISRYFFVSIFGYICAVIVRSKYYSSSSVKDVFKALKLFLFHQTRLENIPLFALFEILNSSLNPNSKTRDIVFETLVGLCVQHLSFFSMGNTNLMATVDLSNAYNGISEYSIFSVSLLTFFSNFSAVLFWLFSQILLISSKGLLKWKAFHSASSLKLAFYLISITSLIGSCINLRYHLFIWSVFSPKLLYVSVWTIGVNLAIDFIFGSIALATF